MIIYTVVAALNMLAMKWLSLLIHRLGLLKVYGQPSLYHVWVILNASGLELEDYEGVSREGPELTRLSGFFYLSPRYV